MTLRRLSPPVGPLAVAAVSLAMAWAAQFGNLDPAANSAPTPAAAPAEPVHSVTLPQVQDQNALVEILQARPLFALGRRVPDPVSQTEVPEILPDPPPQNLPEPQPEPVIEVSAPPLSDLHMVGVMQDGDNMRVLLRNQADQSEIWYAPGDEISGWTLVEITQDAILLRQGEAEITIKMFE